MKPVVIPKELHKSLFILAATLMVLFGTAIILFSWNGKPVPSEIAIGFGAACSYLFGAPLVPERREKSRPEAPPADEMPLPTDESAQFGGDTERGDGQGGIYELKD